MFRVRRISVNALVFLIGLPVFLWLYVNPCLGSNVRCQTAERVCLFNDCQESNTIGTCKYNSTARTCICTVTGHTYSK